jgi:Peptidase S24-like
MEPSEPRAMLQQLIEERREEYSSLSRLVGRNAAYIQQFIKRGSPRRLGERERGILARYFGVDEEVLGGPAARDPAPTSEGLIPIPRFDVAASAGPGALDGNERAVAHIGFDATSLARICRARPRDLSIISVEGESMAPTLGDGDDIMVDRSAAKRRIQDGIYVLRRDDTLLVKRITVHPTNATLTIASDNSNFASWHDVAPNAVEIIGRVVWAARRVR